MRVGLVSLHTSPYLDPGSGDAGGLNVVVRMLERELRARGVDVSVVTDASQLTSSRFDVLHAHYWTSAVAAARAASATGARLVVSFHTLAAVKNAHLAPGATPEPEERLAAEARLAREADAIIASSASEAAGLAAIGAQRVHVVEPGVDTGVFRPGAPAAERAGLAVVGRIQPLKGQDLAIRAMSYVTSPGVLHVVGGISRDPAYRASLDELVSRRGLADRVVFTGALGREDLATLLRRVALVLMPSHSETYGLVALEAAASGVPVVAARAPGLVDAVRDGLTGVLVDGRDEARWGGVVDALLRDPARRQRLGEASVAYAREHTWRRTAEGVHTVYRLVL